MYLCLSFYIIVETGEVKHMIRFVIVAAIVIGFLILSIPLLVVEWLVGRKNPSKRDIHSLKTVQAVFGLILKVSGVTVTVIGRERLPVDQPVLYVGNHRSFFDILVGYASVPYPTGFVAKKEMERIPLLSAWMTRVHCLFLDRVNLKEGLKTILIGIEKVRHGISIWIFPEGTRNEQEDILDLLPFKEGSLKIAEKSGCPIVPVAINRTAEIFEKQFPRIKPSHVTIEFGEPILLKELDPDKRKFSGAYTRDIIIGMLERQKKT